jgi:hypothetical protein
MIKISDYPIVAGAILSVLQTATGPPASALDRWVELTNNTRMTIVEIYISQLGAERWNTDLLSDVFLVPASSVRVSVDDRAGCLFDIKRSSMMALPTSAEVSISVRWRDTRSPIDDGGRLTPREGVISCLQTLRRVRQKRSNRQARSPAATSRWVRPQDCGGPARKSSDPSNCRRISRPR